MINNYFNIAIRSFLKGKAFSLVNVTGLALEISCFTIIMVYVETTPNPVKSLKEE
jgi:hypothetical protein